MMQEATSDLKKSKFDFSQLKGIFHIPLIHAFFTKMFMSRYNLQIKTLPNILI